MKSSLPFVVLATVVLFFLSTTTILISQQKVSAHEGCGHDFAASKQKYYYLDQKHDPFSSSSSSTRSGQIQSTVQWRLGGGFSRNMTLVNNPELDLDIFTNNARSCASTGQMIFVGGRDSGQNCFDANGNRVYQDFCRLTCFENETLNATHKQRLDQMVGEAVGHFTSTLRLQVWSTENLTMNFVSNEDNDCAGMRLDVSSATSLVLAVTARPTRQLGSITAHCSACQLYELNNRPLLVHLNIDPAIVRPEAGYTDIQLKEILIHQIMHGIGISNKSYPLFRHPDDPTKTYFEYASSTYPTGPICSSASTGLINNGGGDFYIDQTKIVPGQKIYFKGPNTIKVAQIYFDCSSVGGAEIPGVELENGGSSERTTAVHLEKRIFLNELFIGTNSWQMYYSSFSMALLQDTGYWSISNLISVINWTDTTAMNYGRSKGCNFLSQKCDQWPTNLVAQAANSGENNNYFCSEIQGVGCGFDRSFIGECNVVNFGSDLPAAYQYFSSTSATKGGQDSLMDYCPVLRMMESGECATASNSKIFDRDITSGMNFGTNARCFVSNMLNSSVISGGKTFGGCFQSFCHFSDQAGYVVVGRDAIRCSKDGEIVELFPPARFNVNNFVPQTGVDTLQLSYNYHGIIQCSSLFSECAALRQQTTSYKNSPIKLANVTSVLPTISAVTPTWGYPTGGTPVTVLGTNLDRCSSAIVGGVALSDFQILNDTAVRGKIGNVGSVYGGPGTDGVGDALVELQCRLLEFPACASGGGCILARTKGVFNFSLEDPNAAELSTGVFSDFFDSAAGKVVGVIMCIIVIILLIVVARLCFKDGEKVGPKYEVPKESNNNNRNNISNVDPNLYQAPPSPLVVDGLNDNDNLFSPTADDDIPPPQQQQSTSVVAGNEQELEPIVVLI